MPFNTEIGFSDLAAGYGQFHVLAGFLFTPRPGTQADQAKILLDQLDKELVGRKKDVCRDIRAKMLLGMGRLEDAAALLDVPTDSPATLGLQAKIEMARADKSMREGYSILAVQHLREAMKAVRRGLAIQHQNRDLLDIYQQLQQQL